MYPSYDQLFAISDLHLGGRDPAMQMMSQPAELAEFFHHLATETPRRTALVLNGDVVDFLAESNQPFDPDGAVGHLSRIMMESPFAQVFEALNQLLQQCAALDLYIAIGNHDVELALPEVQDALRERLGALLPPRITFIEPGLPLRIRIGDRYVLLAHGNEGDPDNRVDHAGLLTVRAHRIAGRTFADATLTLCPGTAMVIDAVNPAKAAGHAFIDTVPFDPLLLYLCLLHIRGSSTTQIMRELPLIVNRWLPYRWTRGAVNRLSVGDNADALPLEERTWLALLTEAPPQPDAHGDYLSFRWPGEVFSPVWDAYQRSTFRKAAAFVQHPRSAMRKAMPDHPLDLHTLSDVDDKLLAAFPINGPLRHDVLIAGHTHLARRVKRPERWYLNTGTWADLTPIQKDDLDSEASFKALLDDWGGGRGKIDGRQRRRFTVAHVLGGDDPELREWHAGKLRPHRPSLTP